MTKSLNEHLEDIAHNNLKFNIHYRVSVANEYYQCANTLGQLFHKINRDEIGDKKYATLVAFVRDMVDKFGDDVMNGLVKRHKNSWVENASTPVTDAPSSPPTPSE